ncbi:MAG: hypothetical protein ABIR67_03020 [Gaiellaceae bacterium]
MLGRLWPRFALEAFFLIAALVAGLLNLSVTEVIVAMAAAYALTVVLELGAWYARRSVPAGVASAPVEDVTLLERSAAIVAVRAGDRPPRPEEEETWLDQLAPPEPNVDQEVEPEAEPEPEPEPRREPEPRPEPEPEALPTSEPQPAEPQPVVEEPEPVPAPEPVVAAPQLTAVPDLEPERVHKPEPLFASVATLAPPVQPQEWNLWELERLTRERGSEDPAREAEWGYLAVLREFARPDGTLPAEFDDLVRESFGDVIAARAR